MNISPDQHRPLRLGLVAYLNMQPLIAGLERYSPDQLELHYGPPSRLVRWLEEGRIDMGMVSVASVFANPVWTIAGHSMIGTRGPVGSVFALGGRKIEDWRVLHPDTHSRTSNALAQVLLRRRFGVSRLTLGDPIPENGWHPPAEAQPDEGFVLIGSRALRWRRHWSEGGPGRVFDLGHLWTEWTGLPFVFAVWAVRPGVDLGDWPERLEAIKADNLARLPEIAAAWPDLEYDRLNLAEATDYLGRNLDFNLDGEARLGLDRFYAEGRALGLFANGWSARLYHRPQA